MLLVDAPAGVGGLARQVSEARDIRAAERLKAPLVRIWDGDWRLRSVLAGEISGTAVRRSNSAGEIEFTIGRDHYLWDWFMERRGDTSAQNTFITVDKDGARISGCVDRITFSNSDGVSRCTVHAIDDMEALRGIRLWSNPVLPAAIQFPRVFMLAGPAAWALKTTLFLNLMRLQNSLFSIPDDPLNFSAWGGNLDMRNWPVTVKGGAWERDGTPHAIVSSRFKNAYEVAHPICEDAGLEITYRRYLPGDPEPWPGYVPRVGQLIFDIVDKSRKFGVQGSGGNVLTGLVRTAHNLVNNMMENDRRVVNDPDGARDISKGGTAAGLPWVVFRETEYSGVESSEYSWQPATHTVITAGGHSLAGVNEVIGAAIQAAGDLASSTFIGPNVNLGQIADTFLKPFYTDTLLAWMSFKMFGRAQRLGWSHYFEYMPSDGDRAYQLSSVLAVRRAMLETGEKFNHSLKIQDGAPYLVGDNGLGDFWVGDLVASEPPGSPNGKLLVDRVSEATYSWSHERSGWEISIGSLDRPGNGWDQIVGRIKGIAQALQDQGVL